MKRVLLVIPVALLAACGDASWKGEGAIVGREYDDDDSYWVPRSESCSGSGLNTVCTASGGYTQSVPERWLLTLETTNEEGEIERHTVSVPASIYESCEDYDLLNTETMECTEVPR